MELLRISPSIGIYIYIGNLYLFHAGSLIWVEGPEACVSVLMFYLSFERVFSGRRRWCLCLLLFCFVFCFSRMFSDRRHGCLFVVVVPFLFSSERVFVRYEALMPFSFVGSVVLFSCSSRDFRSDRRPWCCFLSVVLLFLISQRVFSWNSDLSGGTDHIYIYIFVYIYIHIYIYIYKYPRMRIFSCQWFFAQQLVSLGAGSYPQACTQSVLVYRRPLAIAAATLLLFLRCLSACAEFAEDSRIWCCSPLVASPSTVFSEHNGMWNWDLAVFRQFGVPYWAIF